MNISILSHILNKDSDLHKQVQIHDTNNTSNCNWTHLDLIKLNIDPTYRIDNKNKTH